VARPLRRAGKVDGGVAFGELLQNAEQIAIRRG